MPPLGGARDLRRTARRAVARRASRSARRIAAFALPASRRARRAPRRRPPRPAAPSVGRSASASVDPLADRQRLRKPQQIAGRHRAGDVAPLARALDRAAERVEERLVQLDVERRRRAAAARRRRPRPGRGPRASAPAPRSRVSSGASDGGMRSCRSRNRWLTDLIVTVIVAASSLARQRREAGHALDHRGCRRSARSARLRSAPAARTSAAHTASHTRRPDAPAALVAAGLDDRGRARARRSRRRAARSTAGAR